MATAVGNEVTMDDGESLDPSEFERTNVTITEKSGNEEDETIRLYYHPTRDVTPMVSVTSVISGRVDPDKESSLEGWRNAFDGKNAYSRPWWKDQMAFKGYRGTLAHFAILDQLGDASSDSYYHNVGEKEYGLEEYTAEYNLKKWSKKAPSADPSNDQRPPRNNEYDGEHAWDKAMRDVSWAVTEFQKVWEDKGLTTDDVIDVERYVTDTEYGYAGQFDLLYENTDGEVVLSDLKTSSGIRESYLIQLAGYAHAVPEDVDRLEVIRTYPDKQEVEIQNDTDWDRSRRGLEHEFLSLCDECHNVRLPTALGSDVTIDSLLD